MVKAIPNRIVPIDDETAYMELVADAESDLTDLTSVGGFNVGFGSLCLVIETGDIWAFNSSNTWVNQTGASTSSSDG